MCGLWKQKVFHWPDPCAEQLKESTTILNSCWLQDVFAWPQLCRGACWTPAAALQFREQLHVLSMHTSGLGGRQGRGLALGKRHGYMEPHPSAWETPGLGLGSDVQGFNWSWSDQILSKGCEVTLGSRGLELGQSPCPALGDSKCQHPLWWDWGKPGIRTWVAGSWLLLGDVAFLLCAPRVPL